MIFDDITSYGEYIRLTFRGKIKTKNILNNLKYIGKETFIYLFHSGMYIEFPIKFSSCEFEEDEIILRFEVTEFNKLNNLLLFYNQKVEIGFI